MTGQGYVAPSSCPPGRHYTGTVRTNSGIHGRVLQRSSGYWDRPWLYYKEESTTPSFAADSDVSDLQEIDPFVHHHLRTAEEEVTRAHKELENTEWVVRQLKRGINGMARNPEPLAEDRVREIVREELSKAHWEVSGLTINTRKESSGGNLPLDPDGYDPFGNFVGGQGV